MSTMKIGHWLSTENYFLLNNECINPGKPGVYFLIQVRKPLIFSKNFHGAVSLK